jgi:hypothetical protein
VYSGEKLIVKYYVLLTCVVISIVVFVIIKTADYEKIYEKEYGEKIGITRFWYNDIIKLKGIPESEKECDNGETLYVYYPDCIILFGKNTDESKDKYFFYHVKIISPKYKFGRYNIGIGSSIEMVNKAYRGLTKVNPIRKNTIEYIDGAAWVGFEIDSNKKVKSIIISYGP